MREISTSAIETRQTGVRAVAIGLAAIALILAGAGYFLLTGLPSATAFEALANRIVVEADLTSPAELELMKVMVSSSQAFSDVLTSYRYIIFVLLIFASGLMIAALTFVVMLIALNRRMGQIAQKGIEVNALTLAREQNLVYLNNFEFKLTPAAMETLSVLAEARLDDEVMTGAEIEAVISGRPAHDCDEAAGATRIKRLRDSLGNQMMSELLVKNIARQGYMLAIDKSVIRVL